MSRGQLNFSFSNVKTNYTTEKSIVDTAAKSSEAKIQNVDVDTSTINEVSGQTYDKNEVMDFSTPDTGAQTNPNIDTNQKNTDSFSGQSGSSSAPSGNGTSHTTDNTTTMKDSSKTSNDSGGNINSNASGNSNSSSTSNFSGTRNSNQSNSDNPGMSNSFGSNSKSDSDESAGSSNSSVSSTSFDSKRDDNYASTFNVDPELAAQLKKIGFNEKDINRLMSGKVTYEQLLEEIEKDPERNKKLIEASFLSQLDIEATSIEELNALLDKKKAERENINDQVLNEYLEVNAQYYLMQLLMSNNDLESALQKDMHITVVTYDDGSVMVMSGANEDVKTATDCKVVDLSKYITDDIVEDLKSKLTLKTKKGLFGKEDKQIYVYKSGNEEFRELYNKLTETNTKQWENYKSIKEEKINELDTEISTYEYVRDEINKYVKYHVDDCQKYMVKEDFESKSDYVAGSKEKLKEYIQDSPVEGYSRIVINDEESFALLMECILNGSAKYSSEEFVDPAVGVPYEEKIIIDENGNKYLIKGNYIFQNDFYNHFDEWKQYITEDDIKVFNYILNTEGEKAAYEHLVSISDILDDRWLNNKIAKDEDFATEHPVAASVASIFTTPVDGIAAACNSYAAYLNGQKIRRTDVYSAGDVWRAKISGNIYAYYAEEGKIGAAQTWSFLYGTGMSMLDSLSLVGASVLTGGTATPVLSAVLMGSRSYVSTLNDALDRGLNDGQAIALATTAAIAETAMESWSVSHLLNLEDFLTTTSKNLLGKLKSPILQKTGYKLCMTLSQAFVEGEEEIATEILNFVFDELIAGDLSNFSVRVENYMADGKSEEEAFKLAFKDQGKQFFEAFLGGFVSGFCFGFAKSSTFTHKVSKDMARDISNKYEGKEESFIDRVNAIDEANAEAEKRYKEYKKQLADQFKDDLKTRIKDVGQRIANGFSTVMADNAGKVDLDGFKNSNNARINDKVDTKIFEANANNSEYSSMKQVYDVLNAMIKSDDVETRTIAENISNIQNGNISDLFFTNQLSQYNKSAFAHYDRITLGSGSAFILNYYISNQITAHEFGHMLFGVLDYTKPTDYESVKAKTIENLTNNKQVLDDFFKDAIEYRQKFNEEAKSKITTYLQEHPEVLESMAEDIINNKAAIKQLCKEINLVDSKTELILSQFDNKEVDKLKNNLIALLKYRETIKGIYEAQLYDSEMQQIDMITGIIDSIYEGNNPYYNMYINNGLRYHTTEYFNADGNRGFDEQFADYTAIRVYSEEYAVARTFLGNVLGNEWFDMMGSKYTEIANKITSNNIEKFISNTSNNEVANADSVEHTNASTSQGEKHNISPKSRISELVNSINNVRCDICGGTYDLDGKCEFCHTTSNSNVKNWIQELNTSLEGKNLTFEKDFDTIDNLAKISNLGIESVNRILNDTEYISKANKIIEYIHTNYQSVLSGNVKINTKFLANLITNNSNLLLNPKVKREVLDILMKDIAQDALYDMDTYQTIFTEFANIILPTDYPVKVVFTRSDILGECCGGRYNSSTGEIEIKASNLVSKPYQTIITLFHEMRHHVQYIENFHKETLGYNQFYKLLDDINRIEFIEQYDTDAYYDENYGKNGLLLIGELEAYFTQYTTGFEYLQKLGIKLPDSLIAERNQKLKEINSNMADPYSFFRYYNGEEVDITEISRRLIENKPEYLSKYKLLNFIYKVENGKVVFKNSTDFENDYKAFKEGTLIWNGDFQEISDLYERTISVVKSKEGSSAKKESLFSTFLHDNAGKVDLDGFKKSTSSSDVTLTNIVFNEMPSNLSDIEKARYIYLKLAQNLSFNTKLQNGTSQDFSNLYTSQVSIDTFDKNQVICREWAQLYSELLTKAGIENKIIDLGHQSVCFKVDGDVWVADATYGSYTDLARIKYGDATTNFGKSISNDMDNPKTFIQRGEDLDTQLSEMDKKFGFYDSRKSELADLKNRIKNIDHNLGTQEKLELMFKEIGQLKEGYYEGKDFVRELEYDLFTSEEMKNIKGIELKRNNNKSGVDIVQCICYSDGSNISYYLLSPNNSIQKVSQAEITQLALLGYGKDEKEIPGLIYPKNFKPGKVDMGSFKYRIFKTGISGKISIYDTIQATKLSQTLSQSNTNISDANINKKESLFSTFLHDDAGKVDLNLLFGMKNSRKMVEAFNFLADQYGIKRAVQIIASGDGKAIGNKKVIDSINSVSNNFVSEFIIDIGNLENIRQFMIDSYGEESANNMIKEYLRTGNSLLIPTDNYYRQIASKISKTFRQVYLEILENNIASKQRFNVINAINLSYNTSELAGAKKFNTLKQVAEYFSDSKQLLYLKIVDLAKNGNKAAIEFLNNNRADATRESIESLKKFNNTNKATSDYSEEEMIQFLESIDQLSAEEKAYLSALAESSYKFTEEEKAAVYIFTAWYGPTLASFNRQAITDYDGNVVDGTSYNVATSVLSRDTGIYNQIHDATSYFTVDRFNETLDCMIANNVLEEDLLVYRGANSLYLDNENIQKLRKGVRFNDKAHTSTSAFPTYISGGSTEFGVKSNSKYKYNLQIILPSGTHAAYLESVTGVGAYNQQELLLARNNIYEIVENPVMHVETITNKDGTTEEIMVYDILAKLVYDGTEQNMAELQHQSDVSEDTEELYLDEIQQN